jgi:hypothetical protein
MISMAEEMEGYSVEGDDVDYDEDFSDVDVVVEVRHVCVTPITHMVL